MIVFVILHYMVFEETYQCVESLLKLNGKKKIVIVDNGSPNQTGDKLSETYNNNEEVQVIINHDNLGFACGNNVGYIYAREKYNPEFIVVMNNDMEIRQIDFIQSIEACYKEYLFDIMGPDVYSTREKKHQNPDKDCNYNIKKLKTIRRKIKFKLRFRIFLMIKSVLKKNNKKTDFETKKFESQICMNVPLHGSFYVFSQKFISSHEQCFYNKTFMYMESQILFHQAIREGLRMIYYPRVQVLHHEDVATNSTYTNHYRKAIFTNQCLLKSCEAFIELLEREQSHE